ncbi:MAG: hypothetical protein K9F92_00465 [Candidatus Nanopelagicaceae bacterium]|nr:hypothetical protein [Candidatus Nanopelagicaceae bacterium]
MIIPVVAIGVADALTVAVAPGEVDALAVGDTLTFTFVPLFQTRFFPDFTQKYLTPLDVFVEPTLVHFVPAIVAAFDPEMPVKNKSAADTVAKIRNFIAEIYRRAGISVL